MATPRIRPGSFEMNARRISRFLRFHNYGVLRRKTRGSLKAFQERNGVPATGNLNHQTCRLLNAKRCCHPEIASPIEVERARFAESTFQPIRAAIREGNTADPEINVDMDVIGGGHPYELIHCRWTSRVLRFAFLGAAPRSFGQAAWNAVRRAFETWNATGKITLNETTDSTQAEIRVLWTPGPGADPNSTDPFYGPGGYAAWSYYPYPFYNELAGDLHFDQFEPWSLTGDPETLDIETVTLHEIGHCIGIGHCTNEESVMWPTYQQMRRTLTDSDCIELERVYS